MQRICIYERFILMGPASSLKKKKDYKGNYKNILKMMAYLNVSTWISNSSWRCSIWRCSIRGFVCSERPHQTTHSFNSSSLQHVFAVHDTLCRRSNYNCRRTVVSETDSATCFPPQTPNPHTFFRCKFLLHSPNSLITKRQKDKNS